MKTFALYVVAILLVTGIFFGVAGNSAPQLQAAALSEGSYPTPTVHPNAPQQSMIPGEGSYPSPTCSPSNPKCSGSGPGGTTTIAGEGSYPSPTCSPSNPKCSGSGPGGTTTIAGEGSYPSPTCSPSNPKCGGTGTAVAMLADSAAPMPLYLPAGGKQ